MHMKKTLTSTLLFLSTISFGQTTEDSIFIRKIYDFALTSGQCYEVLTHLCTQIGPRLSGSKGADQAVKYMQSVMLQQKFDKVQLQEVLVPHWERGNLCEVKVNANSSSKMLSACALGGSVAGNIKDAQVVEIKQFDELEKLGEAGIKGKIVFFSRPMEPTHIHTFEAYGGCVEQRWGGAAKAAKYGAIASLTRSMSLKEDKFPHTGSMSYDSLYAKIPAIAISTEDATWLSKNIAKKQNLSISIQLNCQTLPDTMSHNVIGDLVGNTLPNEILLTGGHLDAWDNGQGAHDDGAGCVQSMEALRILKSLGYTPNRTIRAVLFMNEENGLRGGKKYAEIAATSNQKHVLAIESDRGGFTPRGFYIDSDEEDVLKIKKYKPLLEPYGLHDFKKGGGGADIGPLKKQGTLCLGYIPDSQRYFDVHHASSDVIENVNKRELELGAASIAAILYLIDKYGLN